MECKSREEAKKQLGIWNMMATGYNLPEFQACTKTFINWQDEILNSFEYPFTNGYTEEVNNNIKVIKRNAFGIGILTGLGIVYYMLCLKKENAWCCRRMMASMWRKQYRL
jgi:hypothetical protein